MSSYFQPETRTDKKTVLVIDEDQRLCFDLASKTEAMGLNTLTANDAVSAVKIMDGQFPDLLIFDGELPAGNGKTFLERLGACPESCEIPAIVLCNNGDLSAINRVPEIVAYYVHNSEAAWNKIETFIHELVDVKASSAC